MIKKTNGRAILSKSTFIRGLQCEKSLYLHKKRPFLRDRLSPEQLAKFSRGTNVGVYAQQLFPGGVDASPKTHFQMAASVVKTAELMEAGQKIIYEAAFEHAGVIIALDILVKNDKGWSAIEVKSSKSISETYLWDASLQYFVMKGSDIEISDFSIAYINTSFVRKGAINPAELFIIESVLHLVLERQEQVGQKIERLKEVVELKSSPPISIGPQCHKPYPCDFIGHCWKNIPEGSVFELQGIDEDLQFKYFEKGIAKVSDIPETELDAKTALLHRKSIMLGKPIVNIGSLQEFAIRISGETAVFSWLDFKPAIPLFDGTKPYQSVPFSLGMKDIRQAGAELLVYSSAGFPERGMLEELLERLEKHQTILIFGPLPDLNFLLDRCFAGEHLYEKFKEIFSKAVDISNPFADYSISWPGMKPGLTPAEILKGLGHEAILPSGEIKSKFEASIAIEKMASGNQKSDPEEVFRQIDEFHAAYLANIQKLLELIIGFLENEKV